LLAKLRNPAFRFPLVVRVRRRPQIMAQLHNHLICMTKLEMDLREHQAGIRKCVFTLTQHFHTFRGDAALRNQSTAEQVTGTYKTGIDIQSLARLGFGFLGSIQRQQCEGKILMGLDSARVKGKGGLMLGQSFFVFAQL